MRVSGSLFLMKKRIYIRDKIIDYFQKNNDDRITIQSKLRIIGSNRNISFYEFFSRLKEVKKESNIITIL